MLTIQKGRNSKVGTSYVVVRIPLYKEDGTSVRIAVKGTSDTCKLGDWNCTNVFEFAQKHNYLHVINGGIYLDPFSREADGITIIDGEILKTTGVELFEQEQYVLGITGEGDFRVYFKETAEYILQDGCVHAITGFVPLIEDSRPVGEEVLAVCPHYNERHPRQIIGRLRGGDYFTFWCDGRVECENGMTLKECIDTILENIEMIEFAFSLDGGGSARSMIGKKQITRTIEERPVSNVIVFY